MLTQINPRTFGFSTGYVEELYRQFLENPDSVGESWQEFFADFQPSETFVVAQEHRTAVGAVKSDDSLARTPPMGDYSVRKSVSTPLGDHETLRGTAAKVARNMEVGLAIDDEKRGKRTVMVPNIPDAGSLNFAQLLKAYNDIVQRARDNQLEIADFEGTSATITNSGMIGTNLSVPRLMPGQGVIVGVGSIAYPTEYYAFRLRS